MNEFVRSGDALEEILNSIDREKTRVIMMTDHGFDEDSCTHYSAADAWMATDLPVPVTSFASRRCFKIKGSRKDL